MTATFVCACDSPTATPPINPPGLQNIAYRNTDFAALRRALLTPLAGETQLSAWRPAATGDLAVMIAEWWAYLGDILTFYNERIANEAYLGTATQPASLAGLISLLGYRPAPGIGATVTLAALVQPGPTSGAPITLPAGLQVQSKPAPGQMPQIFELTASTPIVAPDSVPAIPPPALMAPGGNQLLLAGAVSSIIGGANLLLRPRDGSTAPILVQVPDQSGGVTIVTLPGGAKQTQLTVSLFGLPQPASPTQPIGAAALYRLERPTQTTQLWSLGVAAGTAGAIDPNNYIHLSGLVRTLKIGDNVAFAYVEAGTTQVWLTSISDIEEVIWDATGIIIPHTSIQVGMPPGSKLPFTSDSGVTMFYNWVEAAQLVDQPAMIWPVTPTSGTPTLVPAGGTPFPFNATTQNVLIADATGAGLTASVTTQPNLLNAVSLGTPLAPLQTPLTVLFNLLQFTRGQTVSGEVLGSGDPTTANQSFSLAKSPLTYLRQNGVTTSTLSVRVNGLAWTKVVSFFGQPPNATIFATAQDSAGNTRVQFGDGVNGARLPAGTGNVIATYRFGSGAAAPPAGALTVIAKPFPGLRALVNPILAGGGADPDPPDQIRNNAPRSVLTFGRAVSAVDYGAIAATAAPGARVSASWAWNGATQRGAVTIYVAGDSTAVKNVQAALAATGDLNRPVIVALAMPLPVGITFTLLIAAGADPVAVPAAVVTALTDPVVGLFGPALLGIGQPVFDSQIAAACQSVAGVIAITNLTLWCPFGVRRLHGVMHGPMYTPAAGEFFSLSPDNVAPIPKVASNGG